MVKMSQKALTCQMTFYKGRLAILSLNESSSDEIEHTLPEHETPNKSAERNSKRKLTHPKGGIKLQLSCSRMRSWQTLTVPPSPHKTILNTAWFSILMYELDKELMEARVRFFLAGRNSVGQEYRARWILLRGFVPFFPTV